MNRYVLALLLVLLLLGIFPLPAKGQVGRGKFGFGLSASGNMLQSDWKTNDPGYGASADVSYSLGNNWGLLSSLGFDTFSGKNSDNLKVLSTTFRGTIAVSYDFLPNKYLNPFVYGGAGLVYYYPRIKNGSALLGGKYRPWDISAAGGIGVDYFLDESWSIIVLAGAVVMGSDALDGYTVGSNDTFEHVSIGIRYYLFDRSTVQRIVDAVKR